jgi:vancomycin aglycone glucosyltransferase
VRVVLSTFGSRGDVEPGLGLAVRLRALGAQVRVCAPSDLAGLRAHVGLPVLPVGRPVRPVVSGVMPAGAWL